MEDALIIDDIAIPLGTEKIIEVEVARLPSGTLIHMPIHVFRSKEPGPVVLLSGGLHGDEINGIETVRRMVSGLALRQLRKGTVIALPIINVYGFIHFSREVPDGKDVNRSFPGNPDGSLASIVAHHLSDKVLPIIDFGIDFHTGGASRTNFPQIRYSAKDELGKRVADAFKAPFTLTSSIIPGSLRATARDLGKSIIVFEGGESLRFDEKAITTAIKGTKRVLFEFGMIGQNPKPRKKLIHFDETQWLRADASGLFLPLKRSGQKVRTGDVLGKINNPYNSYTVKVIAPSDGYIIGHNNIPMVHRGDALFHIGTVSRIEKTR